ncbi:MAG: hypothetical protein ACI8RD_009330 [Bacillariaceae sp.]|jgi:hypothetical protein
MLFSIFVKLHDLLLLSSYMNDTFVNLYYYGLVFIYFLRFAIIAERRNLSFIATLFSSSSLFLIHQAMILVALYVTAGCQLLAILAYPIA